MDSAAQEAVHDCEGKLWRTRAEQPWLFRNGKGGHINCRTWEKTSEVCKVPKDVGQVPTLPVRPLRVADGVLLCCQAQ